MFPILTQSTKGDFLEDGGLKSPLDLQQTHSRGGDFPGKEEWLIKLNTNEEGLRQCQDCSKPFACTNPLISSYIRSGYNPHLWVGKVKHREVN